MENETNIGEFEKHPGTKLIIRLTEWKGKKYVDIREWFADKQDKTKWIPTKKGVSIASDKFSELINVLEQAETKI